MPVQDIAYLLLVVVAVMALCFFLLRKSEEGEKPPKSGDLPDARKSAAPLRTARTFAGLHQYKVIAPAQIAKDGKCADLDFIVVGCFGLLCVKCIGRGGQIYGGLDEEMWLQVNGERRISFVNPMREAEADTRLVRDTLITAGLRNVSVETVCVFTNRKTVLSLPRNTGHHTLKTFRALLQKSKYEQEKGGDIARAVEAVRKWVVQ